MVKEKTNLQYLIDRYEDELLFIIARDEFNRSLTDNSREIRLLKQIINDLKALNHG